MNPLLPTNESIRSAPRGVPQELWEAAGSRLNEIDASERAIGAILPAEAPVVDVPQSVPEQAPSVAKEGGAVINLTSIDEARRRLEEVHQREIAA